MDYHELKTMNVAQLRDVAKDIEGLTGISQMHKQPLLEKICEALGIAMHEPHDVVGVDKSAVKVRIRELKKERDAALDAHDSVQLERVRREIHRLKRQGRLNSIRHLR